jgi:nicotinamidase-related amidase
MKRSALMVVDTQGTLTAGVNGEKAMMNEELNTIARTNIIEKLNLVTEGNRQKFKRIFGHGNIGDPIDVFVAKIDPEKLDWANEILTRAIAKNERIGITP